MLSPIATAWWLETCKYLASFIQEGVPNTEEGLWPYIVYKDGKEPVEGVERQVNIILLKMSIEFRQLFCN